MNDTSAAGTATLALRRPVAFASPSSSPFVAEVKQEVARYFAERGLSTHANASMVLKTFTMVALTFVPYALILSGVVTGWAALALCVVMGTGIAGIGFGVIHDAIHGSYSKHDWVNRLVALLFEVMGGSISMWRLVHNRAHHTFTNLWGLDQDIEATPLVRLTPSAPWRPVHRIQHWLAFVLYGFATLNWVFAKDYVYFSKSRVGPFENRRTWGMFLGLVGGKLVHYAWTIVIPLLVLDIPFWAFLAGYLAMHVTAGVLLGLVFQMAHVVETADFPKPDDEGKLHDAWMVHQMRTTANFARNSRFVTWYTGGLNHQVEHHLFPLICSVHYRALGPIVEACARRNGVPYNDQPTFWSAIRSHYHLLKQLGRPPAAAVS